MDEKLVAGALFSGIGGFCAGFSKLGVDSIWAVENDEHAVFTYEYNYQKSNVIKKNNKPLAIECIKSINLEPVDILHAGFPCQSFSAAGDQKGFSDPRGQLFFQVIRIIKEFKDKKPSVIVLENSDNIKNGDGGSWFIEIMKEIRKAGYWFHNSNSAVLDPYILTYLPQKRKRLFMVAFSIKAFKNGKFNFPSKTHTEMKDLSKFIDFKGDGIDDYYYLHKDNKYYQMIDKEVDCEQRLYQLRKYVVRKKEVNVCPTLTANMGLGGHNVPFIKDSHGIRKLTEYECLSLQGFTSYDFPENVGRSKRYTQIGNTVAVPVIELLAKEVKDKILRERKNG